MGNTSSTAQTTVLEQYKSQVNGQSEAEELGLQSTQGDVKKNEGRHHTFTNEKQQKLAQAPRGMKDLLDLPNGGGDPQDDVSDICSKRDLTVLCEVEDAETGAFLRSTYGYIDRSESAWFGRMPDVRKYDLTVEDLKRTLKRIPDEQIYPIATPPIPIVPYRGNEGNSLYIKRPKLTGYDDADIAALVPGLMLEEARLLEFLKTRPHPNLIRYHGCTLKNGRITGIALEKHDVLLLYRYEDRPLPFNATACMDGIQAGVRYLHSLGLAHNDLNPMNILLNEDDKPIIVDFGSCKKFGEHLISAGTPGWIDDEYILSARENDEAALLKIGSWLAAREKEHELEHGERACGGTPLDLKAGL
ncbi:hypothetical protein LTR48_006163 [Friedmanniomyces endolithicus]|uniref:Protein kinase domain-containing protein n=1 Tax=Rachicladosporium monterosium TaxID=1507873 RepID=A0ABR0KZW8_9PEZI|nr:hypothetical protein LTR48_006163 [Friedmanniomyces endolithicus]KAK5141277.1 hypothetical protein LTR32_006125 [Rachicladosporium monterosium]